MGQKQVVIKMKVLIKKPDANEFYMEEGRWTNDPDLAKFFQSTDDAVAECVRRNMRGYVVLSFRDPRYTMQIHSRM